MPETRDKTWYQIKFLESAILPMASEELFEEPISFFWYQIRFDLFKQFYYKIINAFSNEQKQIMA